MATKQAVPATEWSDYREPTALRVTIRGLRHLEGDTFELDGAKCRNVDMPAVLSAVRANDLSVREQYELGDILTREIFRFDIRRILTDRIVAE